MGASFFDPPGNPHEELAPMGRSYNSHGTRRACRVC